MKVFTALENIGLLGEPDPKFGQKYWGNVEEQSKPVTFNLMKQVDIMPGRKIFAEEYEERISKGSSKPYTQLRKVKLSDPEPTGLAQVEIMGGDNADIPESWTAEDDEVAISPTPQTTPVEAPEEAPSYEAGTNARWAIGMAYRAYQNVMGTPEDAGGEFPFDVVLLHAQELVGMFEILKNPGYNKAKTSASKLPRSEMEEEE